MGSHVQSLVTNKCTISQRTIFVCVCLLFVHYTPGLFLHNTILDFSEQCPWRITHFSRAISPMVFRRSYFHPLPFLFFCVSRTEITSGGRISLAPVPQALSQESPCTPRTGAWSTSFLPPVLVPYTPECPTAGGGGGRKGNAISG